MEIEVSTKGRSPNLHFGSTKKTINKKITSLISAVLEKVIRKKRRSVLLISWIVAEDENE